MNTNLHRLKNTLLFSGILVAGLLISDASVGRSGGTFLPRLTKTAVVPLTSVVSLVRATFQQFIAEDYVQVAISQTSKS